MTNKTYTNIRWGGLLTTVSPVYDLRQVFTIWRSKQRSRTDTKSTSWHRLPIAILRSRCYDCVCRNSYRRSGFWLVNVRAIDSFRTEEPLYFRNDHSLWCCRPYCLNLQIEPLLWDLLHMVWKPIPWLLKGGRPSVGCKNKTIHASKRLMLHETCTYRVQTCTKWARSSFLARMRWCPFSIQTLFDSLKTIDRNYNCSNWKCTLESKAKIAIYYSKYYKTRFPALKF